MRAVCCVVYVVCGVVQGVFKDEIVLDTEGRAILISRVGDPSFYAFMTEGAGLPVFNPVPEPAPAEGAAGAGGWRSSLRQHAL